MDGNQKVRQNLKPCTFPQVPLCDSSLGDTERKLLEYSVQRDVKNLSFGDLAFNLDWALNYLSSNQTEKLSNDKLVICDTLCNLSSHPQAVEFWIKNFPMCVVEIVKIADKNLKIVITTEVLKMNLKNSREYCLTLSSIGILVNILSVPEGLRFMRRVSHIDDFYDLLIWSLSFLNFPQATKLRKTILECLCFASRCWKTVEHLRTNETLYQLLKSCLRPLNATEIIEGALTIMQSLISDITDAEVAYFVIERLPALELKLFAINGNASIKQKSEVILKKAADIYKSYQRSKEGKKHTLQENFSPFGPIPAKFATNPQNRREEPSSERNGSPLIKSSSSCFDFSDDVSKWYVEELNVTTSEVFNNRKKTVPKIKTHQSEYDKKTENTKRTENEKKRLSKDRTARDVSKEKKKSQSGKSSRDKKCTR